MRPQYILVMITAPSQEVAQIIADSLLGKRLAACVNFISPVHSVYFWKGKIDSEDEVLLLVKTREDLFQDRLVPAVKAAHPYETPEIIALPILMGSPEYLEWISSETV